MSLTRFIVLLILLSYFITACHEEGPAPIDMPDPTDTMAVDTMAVDTMAVDTMPVDTMPVDTMPTDTLDSSWQLLVDELKGVYVGICYYRLIAPGNEINDTLYNQTLTVDSISRVMYGNEYAFLYYYSEYYSFLFPEAEFASDTLEDFDLGPSQVYSARVQFIRSQRYLYMLSGIYSGLGFQTWNCYYYKP
jgi:pentapeptide MXKDX repeat protein